MGLEEIDGAWCTFVPIRLVFRFWGQKDLNVYISDKSLIFDLRPESYCVSFLYQNVKKDKLATNFFLKSEGEARM